MTTTTNTPRDQQNQNTRNFQPNDIKGLIQRQGRAIIDDKEIVLKSPAVSDPKLQEIIKDPTLAVNPVTTNPENGEREYELTANGKSVNIKIDCRNDRKDDRDSK